MILSPLVNEINKQFNRNLAKMLTVLVKVFDYMLFYFYDYATHIFYSNIILHYSADSFINLDRGLYSFILKFDENAKRYSPMVYENHYLGYILRNEVTNFKDWEKIDIVG
jgi:hypothetical protein